jgi:hypothetical protein
MVCFVVGVVGLQGNVVYSGFVLDRVVGLQRNVVYSGFVLDRVVGLTTFLCKPTTLSKTNPG